MCVSHARSIFSKALMSSPIHRAPKSRDVLRIMPQPLRPEIVMECLTLHIDRGVALVTLNRPDSMNALNVELRDAILTTARALDTNDDVGAVVFTGAGDKAFCAGADLKERGQKSIQELYEHRRHGR